MLCHTSSRQRNLYARILSYFITLYIVNWLKDMIKLFVYDQIFFNFLSASWIFPVYHQHGSRLGSMHWLRHYNCCKTITIIACHLHGDLEIEHSWCQEFVVITKSFIFCFFIYGLLKVNYFLAPYRAQDDWPTEPSWQNCQKLTVNIYSHMALCLFITVMCHNKCQAREKKMKNWTKNGCRHTCSIR